MPAGVSIVVPCHNAAQRLPQTLAHIAAQQVPEGLYWEVILIDNASTDETSQVALASWPADAPAPLRVLHEPRLGLTYSRLRGFAEAKYEIISCVEDDNWIGSDWLRVVAEIMRQHPNVGACGGFNEAVCEVNPPWWFDRYSWSYAIGPQGQEAGDITWTRGFLWGAGLTVRRSAWHHLVSRGFRPLLADRQGTKLNSGGDSEMCLALRGAGWRLWYEPRLRLRHFLLAHRLNWVYLRRLHRGFGASRVAFDPYHFALLGRPESFRGRLGRIWQREAGAVLKNLHSRRRKLLLSFVSPLEGDPDALYIENELGRLIELIRKRGAYDRSIQEVWEASRRCSC
jgi:glycosyltransferase involved in cell wall biosynthesis